MPILEFNPWMFSGAEQLVESFFIELGAQLRITPDLADLGKKLADYGEAFSGMGWIPVVGTWFERARVVAKVFGKALERRKEGVGARRATTCFPGRSSQTWTAPSPKSKNLGPSMTSGGLTCSQRSFDR